MRSRRSTVRYGRRSSDEKDQGFLELRLRRFGAGDRRDRQGNNNVRCVISGSVAGVLFDRVRAIGSEQLKGISAPIAICDDAPTWRLRYQALWPRPSNRSTTPSLSPAANPKELAEAVLARSRVRKSARFSD
jgi:hypothetical protein